MGSFGLDESYSLDSIGTNLEGVLLTPAAALRDLTAVVVEGELRRAVVHGATFAASTLLGDEVGAGPFAVVDERRELLAVYERRGGGVKPTVVLAPQTSP